MPGAVAWKNRTAAGLAAVSTWLRLGGTDRLGAVEIEVRADHLAEARWLAGAVALPLVAALAALEADTSFQGSGHSPATPATARLEQAMRLRLQRHATGRAAFAEVVNLVPNADS